MSFIDLGMDPNDIDQLVPEGSYELVVADVKEKKDDNGNLTGLLVIHEIQGHPEAANVLHNISLPTPNDDPEKQLNKIRFMKRYLNQFNISAAGGRLDVAQFMGKRATCFLIIEDYEGLESNKIKFGRR